MQSKCLLTWEEVLSRDNNVTSTFQSNWDSLSWCSSVRARQTTIMTLALRSNHHHRLRASTPDYNICKTRWYLKKPRSDPTNAHASTPLSPTRCPGKGSPTPSPSNKHVQLHRNVPNQSPPPPPSHLRMPIHALPLLIPHILLHKRNIIILGQIPIFLQIGPLVRRHCLHKLLHNLIRNQ